MSLINLKKYLSLLLPFDDEIENTSKICKRLKYDAIFLHCVTIYPTQPKDFNLAKSNISKFSKDRIFIHSLSNNKFKNYASLA